MVGDDASSIAILRAKEEWDAKFLKASKAKAGANRF